MSLGGDCAEGSGFEPAVTHRDYMDYPLEPVGPQEANRKRRDVDNDGDQGEVVYSEYDDQPIESGSDKVAESGRK